MGRPCQCCKTDECINSSSLFCTPWLIEYKKKSEGVNFTDITATDIDISVRTNVISGSSFLNMIRCPQLQCTPSFSGPFWNIRSYTDCFGRDQPVDPVANISNPFYYSNGQNNYLGDISIGIKKILRLKKGSYKISVSGFNYSLSRFVFSKVCFPLSLINCTESVKSFYYPSPDYLSQSNVLECSIISGPEYLCEPLSQNPDQIPIPYPQNLKTNSYFPATFGYLVGNYEIIIDNIEDSFLYLEISGTKVSTINFSTTQCLCSNGTMSNVYDNITVYNPESFSSEVSITPLNEYDVVCSNKVKTVVHFKDNGFECY
jgi:hypothetical protein